MRKNREKDRTRPGRRLPRSNSAFLAVFLFGILCGFLIQKYLPGKAYLPVIETRAGGYEYINPLLECDMAQDTVEGKDLVVLRQKVRAFVEEKKKLRGISHVSLYYRDLNNGPWIGIDEKASFSPASLLKVPFMMAVLKEAESNPGLLHRKLTKKDALDSNAREHFKPAEFILWGKPYSVDDLLHLTIIHSDNNAYFLLLNNFPQNKLIKVYTELGVPVPYDTKGEDLMTVSEYASFFRILFNASYLSREMSTKALKILSAVEYKRGLIEGIPASVRVAHKFGERSLGPKSETKQLHDCGIVYYPNHPYLLCVMTRGTSFDQLNDIIADVSKLFYAELNSQYGENP